MKWKEMTGEKVKRNKGAKKEYKEIQYNTESNNARE